MESTHDEPFADNQTQEIEKTLLLAKLKPEDLLPLTQVVYFASEELHHNNYKLLQIDNCLLETFNEQGVVYVKGEDNENAVLCTDTATYDLLETETSNALLLVESLHFRDSVTDSAPKATSKVTVKGVFYDYLEVTPTKPNLQRLHELLDKRPYKGPEYERDGDEHDLYTYSELLNRIQASRNELDAALEAMRIVKVNDKIRILDFEYHSRVLSYMLKLIEENSWNFNEVDYDQTVSTLSDLIPEEIICSLFELYTEKSKVIDGLQLYKYKEIDVCKFVARVLLHNARKFNLQEFLEAWMELVPNGMRPETEMLYGLAIIDTKSVPNTILAFEEETLPDNILERFDVLFNAKDRWTVPEITPYIQRMTTEKTDVNAILAKYARACTFSGVKYYTAKHSK
ncbi:hypothetical protein PPYR_02466 [Photinus pyralis]|uniref:Sister chromatid cohesion protein DCC1 n=2 Tax=Photinus pyralis TaxID=7054 RepID=A0A5N4B7E2_PHOPY|nr:sister chromatid cohesion protein DCC1 isoform X1 [Photinus pyralis]KAB0805496.1 hypothetical protein PPYR_02466 [Photinus pyralis]